MRRILVLLLLTMLSLRAHAQTQWSPINEGLTDLDVRALIMAPDGALFAGTAYGGVFRHEVGATSWTAVNNGLTFPHISRLAMAPDGALYAGTAHPDNAGGGGLFRSLDRGNHWTALSAELSDLGYCHSLAVDSNNRVYTWFSGADYIFQSRDQGNSWAHQDSQGMAYVLCAFDESIFAGVEFNLQEGGIMHLANADATWEERLRYGPNGLVGVGAFARKDGILYAAGTGEDGGFFLSHDDGLTWQVRTKSFPQHSYFTALIFRPFGDLFAARGKDWLGIASLQGPGVLRSTDRGLTWGSASEGLTEDDVRALVCAPDGTLYAATQGGGVFRSTVYVPVELSACSVE